MVLKCLFYDCVILYLLYQIHLKGVYIHLASLPNIYIYIQRFDSLDTENIKSHKMDVLNR